MTSLEFIEKEIQEEKYRILFFEKLLREAKSEEEKEWQRSYIEIGKERLDHLQQIKYKLESLKIIKEKLVLSVETKKATDENGISLVGFWLVQGDFPNKFLSTNINSKYNKIYTVINLGEYETLRKGVEVNE